MATLLVLAVLGLAGCRAGSVRHGIRYEGELHNIWVGRVSGECDFGFTPYNAPGAPKPYGPTIWIEEASVEEGEFGISVPETIFAGGDVRWVEVLVRCPEGGEPLVPMVPRVAVQRQKPEGAQLPESAFLCAAPGGGAHTGLVFRNNEYTMYGRFRLADT